jgi:tricorn protease
LLLCLGLACFASARAQEGFQGYYRQPALRGDRVYFVAEGDLWQVGTGGGRAERLTTHPAAETWPAVSPDGRHIAFSAGYDGPVEAYWMPVGGGSPQRLSWEGRGMQVWGVSPAGEVLATTASDSGRLGSQLVALDPRSGARRTLPVAQASDGAIGPDGQTLYFTRGGIAGDNVRAYRGGRAPHIWQLDLRGTAEARPLLAPGADPSSRLPMPYGSSAAARVAFLSDRSGYTNVWSVDAGGGGLRQHTAHTGMDVRHAAIDGSRVVYALGADLYLLDLAAAAGTAARKLDITLGGDLDQLRTRWVAAPPFYAAAALAPNGERALLVARGRLATQGTGLLRRAELPVPAGSACRAGAFSADSLQVLAICDISGESEIWRFAADGRGAPVRLTSDGRVQRLNLFPSPDGRWLAHTDHDGGLTLTPVRPDDAEKPRDIGNKAQAPYNRQVWWAPDGASLVYNAEFPASGRQGLMLYTLADGRSLPLTSDRYEASSPAYTPDGQWLYFLSERRFEPLDRSPWGDRNLGPAFDRRTTLFALALQPDLRFPFRARDELQAAAAPAPAPASAASAPAAPAAAASGAGLAARPKTAALRVEGLTQRLFEVPLPAGNYRGLSTDGKRLYFLDADKSAGGRSSLRSLAIDDTGTPPELFSPDVQSFALTPDGKRMLMVRSAPPNPGATLPPRAGEILLLDTAAKLPAELARSQVRWGDWQIAVDPRAEWRQLFAEGWRLHRDHLFDSGMNGTDWAAERRRYEPLLPRVTDRLELADLMAQMVTAVGALHSQVVNPDVRMGPTPVLPAGLGGRYTKVAEGFRVDQVFRSDPELPAEAAPLRTAGVLPGEVITAVNGRPASNLPAMAEGLRGQEGRQVLLGVKSANGSERLAVTVPVPMRRDNDLRLADWEWSLAEETLARSQGRIGYLRIRAMGPSDIGAFARDFYSHLGREGLVIDVRGNNGGNIDSWVLQVLQRRAWMWWQQRAPEASVPYPNMQQAFGGHLAVLVDGQTYSDGETFSVGFRKLRLGPLIGQRTAGAGVWLSDSNSLVDNGRMRVAESAQYTAEGEWLVERVGVSPDIEVDLPPRATAAGGDAQLDAALAYLQARMAAQPVTVPKPPIYQRPFRP